MASVPPALEVDQSLGRWLRLARKELREILRDRRTILTLLLMPLLLYPLLGIGFSYLYGGAGTPTPEIVEFRIGFETDADAQRFRAELNRGNDVWLGRSRDQSAATGAYPDPLPNVILFSDSNLDERLRRGELDLGIRIERPQNGDKRRLEWPIEFEITYDPDSPAAKEALRFVRGRLLAANLFLLEESLHR